MKNIHLVFVFFAAVLMATTACNPQTEKVTEEKVEKENCCEHHATKTKAEADTTTRTHKASCRCGNLTATYEGPVPERRTLCHCNSCQSRTGTAFSIQARFPREKVKIEGESTTWTFPNEDGQEVTYRSCDSGGATYHFCPTCGTTVYWDIAAAPEVVGIALGTLTDPTFPAPVISAFEAYGHPWAMTAAGLENIRLEYDELEEYLEKQKQQKQ